MMKIKVVSRIFIIRESATSSRDVCLHLGTLDLRQTSKAALVAPAFQNYLLHSAE